MFDGEFVARLGFGNGWVGWRMVRLGVKVERSGRCFVE